MFGNGSGVTGAAIGQQAAFERAQTAAPESELQYAARVADESLRVLEKLMAELEARLQPVLMQEPPSPVGAEKQPTRAISSPIGQALLTHAGQTDSVARHINTLLRRIAL